jgi:Fe-S cluster assembly protein SufD
MTGVAEQAGHWLAHFTAAAEAPRPWLKSLREAAFARFSELGFPTTHDEEWRFTNVAPIARTAFRPGPSVPEWKEKAPESGIELTFLNGVFLGLSGEVPKGVTAGALAQYWDDAEQHLARHASFEKNAFVALNTAFLSDGAYVRIARGAVVEQPVRITFITTVNAEPAAVHPRILVIAGADSQSTLVESYSGEGPYFTNAVTELVAGDSAVVDHYKIQVEGRGAYHVATLQAVVGRSGNFSSHSISLGGALARNDANALLSEGSHATLNGLYIVNGEQHIDNHTAIDHAKPHATSHELYKGILDGRATAVFNGKILVRKDAQKTDSKQTNKNLVLSDDAVINTKPELQIFADDVRCTHGATIGQLDAESMFYLQSRGIGKAEARSLLTYAFAQDIVDRIKVESLRTTLETVLFEKFHEHAH